MPKTNINWFLLRGLGRESEHWHDMLPLLREAFPADRFFCLDQPGCGPRWQEPSPVLITKTVKAVRGDYLALQQKGELGQRPCYFLSLSLGGMIAVVWGQQYADEFQGSVLINTSLPGINRFYDRLRPSNLFAMIAPRRLDSIEARERKIMELVSNDPAVQARLLPSWVNIQQRRPVTGRNYICMLLSAMSFTAPLRSPFAHTLILKSQRDRLINSRCSDQIAAAWQVPLREHKTAGHDLSSDDPHWIVEQICAWREH